MSEQVDTSDTKSKYKYMIGATNNIASISWSHLTVTTKYKKSYIQDFFLNESTEENYLIQDISGVIKSGMCAIMGSSGSGKTTFLSALAMRLDTYRMGVSGDIRLNGKTFTKQDLKNSSGYVMQDDLLNANFTVGETLAYTAELRMPRTSTHEERKERESLVMRIMGITHCKDVIVGDTRNKGISGGERKRLCIAMELLLKPNILFLDEPTSGLDSSTAMSVMKTLKMLTIRGECMVITTIHQPQAKIFNLFNNLILMKRGHIVYQGEAANATNFFGQQGYPCPDHVNPADHIINILCIGQEGNDEEESKFSDQSDEEVGVTNITGEYAHLKSIELVPTVSGSDVDNNEADKVAKNELNDSNGVDFPPMNILMSNKNGEALEQFQGEKKQWQLWHMQFFILLRRCLHSHLRRWDIIFVNIAVTLVVATFVSSSVWEDIGTHKSSGSKRQAALFFCVIHQGIVSSLQGSHSFPLERALMLRERAAGSYNVSSYFLAKTVADTLVQVISPILYTIMVYPRIGFAPTTKQFFIFMGFMILDSNAATSLTNMVSCLFVSIEMSTVVSAFVYEICRLYGGWFISPKQVSLYPDWRFADALSYIKYAFVGVSLNENSHLLITCEKSELTASGACTLPPLTSSPFTGAKYNAYYGYDQYSISYCAGLLVVYIVVCRFIAYLGLRFIKV
eukprot:gene9365-12616_t